MKSSVKYLWFSTKGPREFINVTRDVADFVAESGIAEGMCLVSAMHITAGVFVNDAEDGILEDIMDWAEGLAPEGPDYRHHRTGEVNGHAHLKSVLVHHQAQPRYFRRLQPLAIHFGLVHVSSDNGHVGHGFSSGQISEGLSQISHGLTGICEIVKLHRRAMPHRNRLVSNIWTQHILGEFHNFHGGTIGDLKRFYSPTLHSQILHQRIP